MDYILLGRLIAVRFNGTYSRAQFNSMRRICRMFQVILEHSGITNRAEATQVCCLQMHSTIMVPSACMRPAGSHPLRVGIAHPPIVGRKHRCIGAHRQHRTATLPLNLTSVSDLVRWVTALLLHWVFQECQHIPALVGLRHRPCPFWHVL